MSSPKDVLLSRRYETGALACHDDGTGEVKGSLSVENDKKVQQNVHRAVENPVERTRWFGKRRENTAPESPAVLSEQGYERVIHREAVNRAVLGGLSPGLSTG